MKEKVKDAWVKALRSGQYKQTKYHLKDETGHDVLGVLCEVLGMKPRKVPRKKFYTYGRLRKPILLGSLPPTAKKKAGMWSDSGWVAYHRPWHETVHRYIVPKYLGNLCVINDDGTSFEQLADIIEQEWKYL